MWFFPKRRPKRLHSAGQPIKLIPEINDRQDKLDGYFYDRWQAATVALIGAGANGWVGHQLKLKGVGHLEVYDDDTVDYSNLTRQPYSIDDVGRYKSHATARRLIEQPLYPLSVTAYPFRFQEIFNPDDPAAPSFDVIIATVDNNTTRRAVAQFAHRHGIPAIIAGVGRDANAGYIMVQEPGQSCWGCAFPQFLNDATYPCGLPATIDIVSVICGHIVHAADTIIGTRPRQWNLREMYLDGGLPDRARIIEPLPGCAICQPTPAAA